MTEEIHMSEFFFFTYDSILKKLDKEEGYKENKEKLDKLTKKFPVIEYLHEGKIVNNEATKEEMQAIQKYMELKFDMQRYVEREHYLRGYRDCILFLIHCGALGTNFEVS